MWRIAIIALFDPDYLRLNFGVEKANLGYADRGLFNMPFRLADGYPSIAGAPP